VTAHDLRPLSLSRDARKGKPGMPSGDSLKKRSRSEP
jgi:hypothetical protein